MLRIKHVLVLLVVVSALLTNESCKKTDNYITSSNAILTTSRDTLKFDTVFTTVGSVTNVFKIFNNNNQKLKLSSIRLMGGAISYFKMNVDGLPGIAFSNVDIAANDSIYVYVTVNINPNSTTLPFVVSDSVQLQYNGNTKYVQLQAYGQNAVFLQNQKITGNVTWTNTLPIVILGGLRVDTLATLTIQKGTKIYCRANAPIIVDGTLITQGEKWDSTRVVFQGDRLDVPYRDFPAGWPGILFNNTSKNNVLEFTTLKNAYQALVVDGPSTNTNPKLILKETIIDNAYDVGLLAVKTSVQATNTLVSNCGTNIAISNGGAYSFNHCTVVSYSNANVPHKNPVLLATNYLRVGNSIVAANALSANFNNCIFWGEFGNVDDEVVVDKTNAASFSVHLSKCLYKVKTNLSPIITNTGSLMNLPPQFDSIATNGNFYNFRLKATSPAHNTALPSSATIDLDGKPRPVGLPDIGCFERQ